ncbi:AAA family ATPase [Bdellovibrionota bacterium FG-1]
MYQRHFLKSLRRYLKQFPVVVLTGARQVGKTTLLRQALEPEYKYVLLEDPDTRRLAIEDPRTFLARHPAPLIIDEFQYAPELTSYLQGLVDERRKIPAYPVVT